MGLFSTTIKVPVDTLQEKANTLISLAEDHEDVFDRIANMLEAMEGTEWEGSSLHSAMTATQEHKQKFDQTIAELKELAEFLKKFAEEISAKDEEIKSKITAI